MNTNNLITYCRLLCELSDIHVINICTALSKEDLMKLELALTEFLDALKSVGMDIKSAKPGELTRKDVIEHLEHIDQHHYSSLLQKREGNNPTLY